VTGVGSTIFGSGRKMPFKKIASGKDKGKYRSESGRVYTKEQVRLYYATDGFKNMGLKRRGK